MLELQNHLITPVSCVVWASKTWPMNDQTQQLLRRPGAEPIEGIGCSCPRPSLPSNSSVDKGYKYVTPISLHPNRLYCQISCQTVKLAFGQPKMTFFGHFWTLFGALLEGSGQYRYVHMCICTVHRLNISIEIGSGQDGSKGCQKGVIKKGAKIWHFEHLFQYLERYVNLREQKVRGFGTNPVINNYGICQSHSQWVKNSEKQWFSVILGHFGSFWLIPYLYVCG